METFEKARLYGIDKNNFTIISEFYGMVVLTVRKFILFSTNLPSYSNVCKSTQYSIHKFVNFQALLHYEGLYKGWVLTGPMLTGFGYWPSTWDVEIGRSIAFSILAMGFNNIVGLPLSLYSTFVLEEKHGFNKQTFGFFVKDFIKKIIVSIIITSPIVGLLVKIVQAGGQYFFVWLWVFCFIVLMFLMTIYPMLIAPLFDKYTPLKEGPLRTRIENLAAKIKFPLTKLYVVEGSKRSAHSNAYLYGFFNNKRIVLYDTLIKGYVTTEKKENENVEEKEDEEPLTESTSNANKEGEEKGCDDEEIEAVLGHELGHWKLNHVVKNIIISQANLFIIFCLFAFFYRNSALYEAFGFPKKGEMPILLGLIIVLQFLLQIFNTVRQENKKVEFGFVR